MRNSYKDFKVAIILLILISAFAGWAVIELVLWLLSFVSIGIN